MKRICVYCGSNAGKRAGYVRAADELGAALVERGLGLVYGGGSIGMMGRIADAVMARGGEVIGVIPKFLHQKEVVHSGLSRLEVVDDMHTRKALMMELSDGFVAMPGGLGTLEELFEVFAWAKLGLHNKPCAVLNVDGYYDELSALLARVVAEGFAKPKHISSLIVEDTPAQLLQQMAIA